jgi:sec-independent protein translocase protein TatB
MFDIGWGELLVIGIVALIAIGPKELPTVMRTIGQWMGKVRRMASEFQGQFQEAMREADMADLKKQADEFKTALTDATNIDPLAESDGAPEPAAVTPEPAAAEAASAEAAVPADAPAAAAPQALPDIEVPPAELPAPVSEKDFAPVEPTPPPKQAGGKA